MSQQQERPAGVKDQLPSCPCRANDHSTWVEKPHPRLRGMLETRCGKCGRWIGNRPQEYRK